MERYSNAIGIKLMPLAMICISVFGGPTACSPHDASALPSLGALRPGDTCAAGQAEYRCDFPGAPVCASGDATATCAPDANGTLVVTQCACREDLPGIPTPTGDAGVTPDGGVSNPGRLFCALNDPTTPQADNLLGWRYVDTSGNLLGVCVYPGTPLACATSTTIYDACGAGLAGTPCHTSGFNACNGSTGAIVCSTNAQVFSLAPTALMPLPPTAEACTLQGQTPVDEDCDGVADATIVNGVTIPTRCAHDDCFGSADSDAYGVGAAVDVWNTAIGGSATCSSLTPPAQGIYVSLNGDCNDADPAINPAAREICDGIDNNCVGGIDEMSVCQNFVACNEDKDGDGQGDSADAPVYQMNVASCQPIGAVASVSNALDCNDNDALINRNVDEICDLNHNVDENCNGQIDNAEGIACTGGALTCAGQNGTACSTGLLGVCAAGTNVCGGNSVLTCTQNAQAAAEITCNGIDENCNGPTDDTPVGGCGLTCTAGIVCSTGLLGVCSAGLTACNGNVQSCLQGTQASTEVCTNGIDEDCDGTADDGCPPPVGGTFSTTITLASAEVTLTQANLLRNGFNCNAGPLVIDGTTSFTPVAGTSCTVGTVSGATTITCSGIPAGTNYDVRFCGTSGGTTGWVHSSHLAPGNNACVLTTAGYSSFASMTVSSGTISATTNCDGRACCIHQQ